MQLDFWDFKSKLSQIHLEKLWLKSFSGGRNMMDQSASFEKKDLRAPSEV